MPIESFTFFTMLSWDRAQSLAGIAKKAATLDGEFWDVGCNGGGSAAIMKEAVPKSQIRLFDSFEGLPESTKEDGPGRAVGEFIIPYSEFLKRLGTVYKGWVPETFKGLENSKIALAHVDLDYYKGTKEALQFILPRIVSSGYVIVDDYNSYWVGVKPAADETIGSEFMKLDAPPEQGIWQRIAI